MKRIIISLGVGSLLSLAGCGIIGKSNTSSSIAPVQNLQLLDTLTIPFDYIFKNTRVGGLSGITYNTKDKLFYIISDDPSVHAPARVYAVELKNIGTNTQYIFRDVMTLLSKTGKVFLNNAEFNLQSAKNKSLKYNTPIPEDIAYRPSTNQFVWVNEGALFSINEKELIAQPSINLVDLQGRTIADYPLPKALKIANNAVPANAPGFKSLTIAPSGSKLFTCTAQPLVQDVDSADDNKPGYVRLLQYRDESRSLEASYAYPMGTHSSGSAAIRNNIVAMVAENDSTVYVLERNANMENPGNVQLYKVNLKTINRIKGKKALYMDNSLVPLHKELVYDFSKAGLSMGNVDGMCWGPKIKGKQTLILITDNDFSSQSRSMIYIFSVN